MSIRPSTRAVSGTSRVRSIRLVKSRWRLSSTSRTHPAVCFQGGAPSPSLFFFLVSKPHTAVSSLVRYNAVDVELCWRLLFRHLGACPAEQEDCECKFESWPAVGESSLSSFLPYSRARPCGLRALRFRVTCSSRPLANSNKETSPKRNRLCARL